MLEEGHDSTYAVLVLLVTELVTKSHVVVLGPPDGAHAEDPVQSRAE